MEVSEITEVSEVSENKIMEKRKEKIKNFLTVKYTWISYIVLAFIVYLSVKIRTANLDRLRDISTGTWTLGPDLDPFLFLRWAKYIVENGTLFTNDMMRYVPIGYDVKGELILHPYMIAWFHKFIATPFLGAESVTHSAVLYPVFFFAITVIAFFFLVRKIFSNLGPKQSNIIALASAFILTVMPPLLPRTIAGIPEKESAAFFFFFISFFFFLSAWQAKKRKSVIIYSILAGLGTAGMALIWGGFGYIFLILTPTILIAFLLDKYDKEKIIAIGVWLFTSLAVMIPFSTRYTLIGLLSSIATGAAVLIFLLMILHKYYLKKRILKWSENKKYIRKIPLPLLSLILVSFILLIITFIPIGPFGPEFLSSQVNIYISNLVQPATSRLIQTVAENRQPFFNEWSNSFGPHWRGLPILFWLFFAGSIYLFYKSVHFFSTKERIYLTGAFTFLMSALAFSRYAPSSTFNGSNSQSTIFLVLGFLIIIIISFLYYYKYHKNKEANKLKEINISYVFLILFIVLGIISARGAVRLIMILAIPISIVVPYFAVSLANSALKSKSGAKKLLAIAIASIVIIATVFAAYTFYNQVSAQSAGFAPSTYTQQWQKSMGWVRDNTPEDAVFGHWWDYGYWVQSLGERATVLDGGNAVGYWNHLMGRHALTGTSNDDALEFLYAHKTTHFLIDSTDIGKYGAYSLIGSDANLDRAGFIPSLIKNNDATRETKNSTIIFFQGGSALDEDIIYEQEGRQIFLPSGKAGLGAIQLELDSSGNPISQPLGVYIYQNQQYILPLRYLYLNSFHDFGSGVESGIYIFPLITQTNQISIDPTGAAMYLSPRTVKSQLARLYLYNEDNPNFKLVHSEDDFVISQLKAQDPGLTFDIAYFQGIRGPIKIWEIEYPSYIEFNPDFVDTTYPEEIGAAR